MPSLTLSPGTVHKIPPDMYRALASNKEVVLAWESLTPLARNEWICWVEFVKKAETRNDHIRRLTQDLKNGKRRPCCWLGCLHRKDKPLSPSIRAILKKRNKK